MTASKQPSLIPDGLHTPPHSEQDQCVVQGYRIDGSGRCTVIAIRDRRRYGWVLYPHGENGLEVLLADEAAQSLADRLGGRS